MVAPNYAAARSALAKSIGLGQKRRKTGGKGKRKVA
jgi:predicted transcriptional regulator